MHEHVGKRAKMQRNKESQTGAQSTQGKQNIIARNGEGHALSTPTSQRYVSQMVTSKEAIRGMDANTQASGPKD